MKLYYMMVFNPRVALAAARYMQAPVEPVAAYPSAPDNIDAFREKNPNLKVPILEEDDGTTLWETDAIVCRLAQITGSDFWRTGAEQPRMIQWLSWYSQHLNMPCGTLYTQRIVNPKFFKTEPIDKVCARATEQFLKVAPVLDQALEGRKWLLGDEVSYADFRVATPLPYAEKMALPLDDLPNIRRLGEQLMQIDAWRDPLPR